RLSPISLHDALPILHPVLDRDDDDRRHDGNAARSHSCAAAACAGAASYVAGARAAPNDDDGRQSPIAADVAATSPLNRLDAAIGDRKSTRLNSSHLV